MPDSEHTLRFEGPFHLAGFQDRILFQEAVAQQSGIYLWTVPYIHGGLLVLYVGETGVGFGSRMKEHLIRTVGGDYRVSDPDQLTLGVDRILWNGLWRKGTRDKIAEFIERLAEFTPIVKRYVELIRVLVAPIETERRTRQRIEGALAEHIKNQPAPVSSLLPDDVRYLRRSKDEELFSVNIMSEAPILGLPSILEA